MSVQCCVLNAAKVKFLVHHDDGEKYRFERQDVEKVLLFLNGRDKCPILWGMKKGNDGC